MATYSTSSTIGALLENAGAKAVLLKHIPAVVNSPQISQGLSMTLASVAQFVPILTPDMLAKIDAELAQVS
jgi:hypothetical protein